MRLEEALGYLDRVRGRMLYQILVPQTFQHALNVVLAGVQTLKMEARQHEQRGRFDRVNAPLSELPQRHRDRYQKYDGFRKLNVVSD